MSNLPVIPRTVRSFSCEEVKEPIRYRSFSTGMHTVLLEAKAEEKASAYLDALRQLVDDVVVSDLDVDNVPFHVLEKIFVKSRCISLGSNLDINLICTHKLEDGKECGHKLELHLDLDKDIDVVYPEGFQRDFKLSDEWSMRLRLNNINTLEEADKLIQNKNTEPEDILMFYIDCIYTDEEVITREELLSTPESRADFRNWCSDLGSEVLLEVMDKFYKRMPYYGGVFSLECPNCGTVHDFNLKGINELFQ